MASAVDTDAQRAPGGSDLVAETPAPASGTPAAPAQPTGTTATTTGSGSGHGDGGQDDDDDDGHLASSMMSLTSVTSPPYWLNSGVHQHQRSASSLSADSLPAGAITLRDNDTSEHNDRNDACWAKSVEIVDYTVVNGSATNIGAFVVWIVRVETLNGSYMNIRKRYSEFDDLRRRLMQSFPGFGAAVPELPPKSVISKFRPRFLEKRRAGLQYFLNCIMLNPEFSGSPVLKEFLFS
ncbi:sorting nexin-like protein [Purpureocillium lilacinum]|uniref:Endosomal/vacuolar adapter protein YPT35 n=2 Tax=Purpureocillium lilacinum TaxID=33203 RepID=A0A179GJH0_PURLI|nr:sorting nexin-like protein [Purpureocillium lilacinum]OAQ76477.1 sorting nexin-like protein [Purpureocillium lilacinum]OAQ78016.1 sorting nexin-like protein [Purpureocillium lilacinum]GJN70115.1 PX domain-containing protein ypt35 [Purpureocillium lilacinum]